ncbi:MAG: AAA domain-containing protein [Candidatus Cryosericum sp.]
MQIEAQDLRGRATRLFKYLKDLALLRTKTTYSISDFEDHFWLADLPQADTHCYSCLLDQQSQTAVGPLMEVHRPKLLPLPSPPDSLLPWIRPGSLDDPWVDLPELVPDIDGVPDDGGIKDDGLHLADFPKVRAAWDEYIEHKWWPWAEKQRPLVRVQEAYTKLFTFYTKQQRLGELYEVVLALGFLQWKTSNGQEVKRHLLVTPVNVEFEPNKAVIRVQQPDGGSDVKLEQDMLDGDSRPEARIELALGDLTDRLGDRVWDREAVGTILRSWVNGVSAYGRYEDAIRPTGDPTSKPIVSWSPALVIRQRTQLGLVRTYDGIVADIEASEALPVGVQRIISVVESPPLPTDGTTAASTIEEPLFPLPSNAEQRAILERLTTADGLVVQGPPGTGKSHTIANLVCHLLAQGKRVLVTSQAPRALRVLQNMIPEDMRSLCISVLGTDRASATSVENIVTGILNHREGWNEVTNSQTVTSLTSQREQERGELAECERQLRLVRESETTDISTGIGQYRGTLSHIAAILSQEEPEYSWLKEFAIADNDPPLSNSQVEELLALIRWGTPEIEQAATQTCPDTMTLPSAQGLQDRLQVETTARSTAESGGALRDRPLYGDVARLQPQEWRSLLSEAQTLSGEWASLAARNSLWVGQLLSDVLSGQPALWTSLMDSSTGVVNKIKADGDCSVCLTVPISGLEDGDTQHVLADAQVLLDRWKRGQGVRMRFLLPAHVRRACYIVDRVCVDGCRCSSADLVTYLVRCLRTRASVNALRQQWSSFIELGSLSSAQTLAMIEGEIGTLDKALHLGQRIVDFWQGSANKLRTGRLVPPSADALGQLCAVTEQVELDACTAEAGDFRRDLISTLRHLCLESNVHPAIQSALQAAISGDCTLYASAMRDMEQHRSICRKLSIRNSLLQKLQACTPTLAAHLASTPDDTSWDDRLHSFEGAWQWTRADRWLDRMSDSGRERELSKQVTDLKKKLQQATTALTAAMAWRFFLHRMTEEQRKALVAWLTFWQAAGRQKGKYTGAKLANARQAWDVARPAIPAWIMPIYQVADVIRPGQDAFDVVIVDEASQLGVEAAFLQYLGKKVIVVGDDKQISPANVGLNIQSVTDLQRRYLADIPFASGLGPDASYFDLAKIWYPSDLALREHFRCMPEIIEFSNRLCYSARPLIPLRQYGEERLEPLCEYFVSNGYRKGAETRVMNPPEAEAIAGKIADCSRDSRYKGKSFGVISLQGPWQATEIDRMLVREVGPEEMERRRIVCGDPYALQGDERDVIFLSLVAAVSEEHHFRALTDRGAQQRFNVAASRARDQLWLFHSVSLDDLSPEDMRFKLLDYFLHPAASSLAAGPGSPMEDAFDSTFEREVYQMIQRRGFNVVPQVPVAGYWIDLVVTGPQSRLAIECDGEVWHGPDRYASDMERQRQLERCGWRFWRVRGSLFFRDPERALSELWPLLDRLGIFPRTAAAVVVPVAAVPQPPVEALVQPTPELVDETQGRSLFPCPVTRPGLADDSTGHTDHRIDSHQDVAGTTRVHMLPYKSWALLPAPDPRSASWTEAVTVLISIVAAEGPIVMTRLIRLYARAAGFDRVGRLIREALEHVIKVAVRKGILAVSELQGEAPELRVVYMPEGDAVVLRTRGERDFEEIPLSEVAALVNMLAPGMSAAPYGEECDRLYRRILEQYNLIRMTPAVKAALGEALERAISDCEPGA